MTPKEKAIELVDNFRNYVDSEIAGDQTFEYSKEQETSLSKKCALIVVDEILLEISHGRKLDWIRERKKGQEYIVYWNEVKEEIKQLK